QIREEQGDLIISTALYRLFKKTKKQINSSIMLMLYQEHQVNELFKNIDSHLELFTKLKTARHSLDKMENEIPFSEIEAKLLAMKNSLHKQQAKFAEIKMEFNKVVIEEDYIKWRTAAINKITQIEESAKSSNNNNVTATETTHARQSKVK